MECSEGYTEVDSVVIDGGLYSIGFEDCVLMTRSINLGGTSESGGEAHYGKDSSQMSGHFPCQPGGGTRHTPTLDYLALGQR